jgi:hypothetical protein
VETVYQETVSRERIVERREQIYHRTPERRLETAEEARSFVEELGFCHFRPIKGVEMPNLFHAVAGRARLVPRKHRDPDLSRSWRWKDEALGQRWWYYAKLLRRRATLVSLDLLPTFYAVSENFGELTDYLDEYRDGLLSAEAKDIYEALLEHGPLDTIRLRREARMTAGSAKSRFDRGLRELQVGLKVLPIGVAETGAWNYAFIYELLPRYFPGVPEAARALSRSASQQALIQRYLDNVVAAERKMVRKAFHVFRWSSREWKQAFEALLEAGSVREVKVEGETKPQLLSVAALET